MEISFKSQKLYIYTHLGLGDCIDTNAMIRIILKEGYKGNKYDKVVIFAKSNYHSMIKWMYRDEPLIEIIKIDKNKEQEEIIDILNNRNNDSALIVGHNNYSWGQEEKLGMGCAEIFYHQVGIPFERRFSDFYFQRDRKEEQRVFEKLNPNNEPFIFIHDDPSRGFTIPEENVRLIVGKNVRIIRNDITENIFFFCKILEEAEQIHLMESAFRSLVETLNINGDLYFHNFREGASGYLGNSTIKSWREIKY